VKARVLRWLPALAWAATIFWLSSRSHLPELPSILGWDKLQHASAYVAGGFLLSFAVGDGEHAPTLAAALGLLYGISDEIHQSFVPLRDCDVHDWFADATGVLLGIALFHLFLTVLRRRAAAAQAAGSFSR
jgi:VanZ family protein